MSGLSGNVTFSNISNMAIWNSHLLVKYVFRLVEKMEDCPTMVIRHRPKPQCPATRQQLVLVNRICVGTCLAPICQRTVPKSVLTAMPQRIYNGQGIIRARKPRSHVHTEAPFQPYDHLRTQLIIRCTHQRAHDHMYTQARSSAHADDDHMHTQILSNSDHMYPPLLLDLIYM